MYQTKNKEGEKGGAYLGRFGNDFSTKPDQEQLSDQRRLFANFCFKRRNIIME